MSSKIFSYLWYSAVNYTLSRTEPLCDQCAFSSYCSLCINISCGVDNNDNNHNVFMSAFQASKFALTCHLWNQSPSQNNFNTKQVKTYKVTLIAYERTSEIKILKDGSFERQNWKSTFKRIGESIP